MKRQKNVKLQDFQRTEEQDMFKKHRQNCEH